MACLEITGEAVSFIDLSASSKVSRITVPSSTKLVDVSHGKGLYFGLLTVDGRTLILHNDAGVWKTVFDFNENVSLLASVATNEKMFARF